MIMNYDGVILGGFDILRPQDVENCVDPVSPLRKIFNTLILVYMGCMNLKTRGIPYYFQNFW